MSTCRRVAKDPCGVRSRARTVKMFSVAQPTTQLNATEQDTLVKQIGLALLRAAPRDWRKVSAEYRAVGRYHELTGEIGLEDGSTQEWVATHDIATLFGRLRAGMYRDGRGTWFNARYQLDHPSSYNLEYNRDEPQWHLAPPPQAYSDELRMFPRTEENVPEWLIRRMSGLGPEQPGPHFRIARIFDTIGPAGRPVINRPDLDMDEQDRLLDYLDHAPVVVQDRGYDIDRLAQTPEATVPVAFHSDGQWIWPAAVNFYLRTYGVSPEADLIDHIRANGFQLPQVDDQALQGAAAYLTRGSQPPQQRPGAGGPGAGGPGAGGPGAGGPGGPNAGGPGGPGSGAPGAGGPGGPGSGGPGVGGPGAGGPGVGGPGAGGPGAGGPGGPAVGGPGGPNAGGPNAGRPGPAPDGSGPDFDGPGEPDFGEPDGPGSHPDEPGRPGPQQGRGAPAGAQGLAGSPAGGPAGGPAGHGDPQATRVAAPVSGGPESPSGSHGLGVAAAAAGAAGAAGAAAYLGTRGEPDAPSAPASNGAAGYSEPGHSHESGYDEHAGYDNGYPVQHENYDAEPHGYEEAQHQANGYAEPHGYDEEPHQANEYPEHSYDEAPHQAEAYSEQHGYEEASHQEADYDQPHEYDEAPHQASSFTEPHGYDAPGQHQPAEYEEPHVSERRGPFDEPAAPVAEDGLVGADGLIGSDGLIGAGDEPPRRRVAEPEAGRRSAPVETDREEGGRRRAQPENERPAEPSDVPLNAEADRHGEPEDHRPEDELRTTDDAARRSTEGGRRSAEAPAETSTDAEPAAEHGSHAGVATAGIAAAGGLAAAGIAAAHGRADERSAEPPFEQDFDGGQYEQYDGDEDYTEEHHGLVPGPNGTGPVDDGEDHTAPYEPIDVHHEEPVLFTHGNEPAPEDEPRPELFTHADGYHDDSYQAEPEYDAGPPTATIRPGDEIPGSVPMPELPIPPSGGRRAAREQAEPAPVRRRELPAEPELHDLQAKLDQLDVPDAAYRLGAPTERGWSVEQVSEGWRVGWYDGELINPAVFGDAEDAAAFMLGKVLLHPDGYVVAETAPEPEPEPAPVPDAPKPPVLATLPPEIATGSFPVRPREAVPPQEQTAFTPADQLLSDDEPPARPPVAPPAQAVPPAAPPTQIAPPVAPPTQVAPPVAPPTQVAPPVAPPTQVAPPVAPPRREPPVRRDERANGGQWPIGPLSGEPPLTLFRGKELRELPAGSELDRFGGPNGNLTYAAGTPFEERSLVPEWVNRPYHVYRVQRPLETLAGVAIPWFNQPGGGSAYLLPASIEELLAEGDLIELDPGEPPID